MRKALEPGLRLSITLRYLASGDSYRSLSYSFRVAANTIVKVVPETCQAIVDEYLEEVIKCPRTPEDWKEVADDFSTRWNFHYTLGAIDGKHVAIKAPPHTGSYYYNCKGFFSIVMLAVVDANYRFLYVDVGANGRSSDAGIFNDSGLHRAVENGKVGFPEAERLPGDDRPIPYFFVGNDAFALRSWMMKP